MLQKITHYKIINFTTVEKHDGKRNYKTPNQQHSIDH